MNEVEFIVILLFFAFNTYIHIWITNSHLDRMEIRIRKVINNENVDEDDIG